MSGAWKKIIISIIVAVVIAGIVFAINEAIGFIALRHRPLVQIGDIRAISLDTYGYGYEMGDIILVNTGKSPDSGDIVYYNAEVNRSHCGAFGPGVYLAEVTGLPGDEVSFTGVSYTVRGRTISLLREFNGNVHNPKWDTKQVLWGNYKYDDVVNMVIQVPEQEYLADRRIGSECTGETYKNSSIMYNRYTIKQEAIIGVVTCKLGNSVFLRNEFRKRLY